MTYRCPACKQLLERDGRKGNALKSYCGIKGKNVTLRKVSKAIK